MYSPYKAQMSGPSTQWDKLNHCFKICQVEREASTAVITSYESKISKVSGFLLQESLGLKTPLFCNCFLSIQIQHFAPDSLRYLRRNLAIVAGTILGAIIQPKCRPAPP